MTVISASGRLTGGRVVHHLAGGADKVKVHGEYIHVRAEVVKLDGFSAHADADELVAWLERAEQRPQKLWLVHGEPAAADSLRLRIEDELRLDTEVAADRGETGP